MENIR
jgi:hypothetical protein